MLAELARQQLEGALACLDELGCHQAAAFADMALQMLLADQALGETPVDMSGGS